MSEDPLPVCDWDVCRLSEVQAELAALRAAVEKVEGEIVIEQVEANKAGRLIHPDKLGDMFRALKSARLGGPHP